MGIRFSFKITNKLTLDMTKQQIQLINMSIPEFQEMLRSISKETLEELIERNETNLNDDDLLTAEEAGKLVGVSKSTIYNRRTDGTLTAYKLKGAVRYKKSEVLQLFKPTE